MATEFVENVLRVHGKYRGMIVEVFQADQAFMGAMDKAMSSVINFRQPKTQSKSPELVSCVTSP
jgi:cullin 2